MKTYRSKCHPNNGVTYMVSCGGDTFYSSGGFHYSMNRREWSWSDLIEI